MQKLDFSLTRRVIFPLRILDDVALGPKCTMTLCIAYNHVYLCALKDKLADKQAFTTGSKESPGFGLFI